jgi:hypothetical protein
MCPARCFGCQWVMAIFPFSTTCFATVVVVFLFRFDHGICLVSRCGRIGRKRPFQLPRTSTSTPIVIIGIVVVVLDATRTAVVIVTTTTMTAARAATTVALFVSSMSTTTPTRLWSFLTLSTTPICG